MEHPWLTMLPIDQPQALYMGIEMSVKDILVALDLKKWISNQFDSKFAK